MPGELGAVVEGDGAPQARIERLEPGAKLLGDGLGGLAGLACAEDEAGLAFVCDEDGLAGDGEGHEIAFPMAEGAAADRRTGAAKQWKHGPLMRSSEDRLRWPSPPRLCLRLGR